MSRKLRALGGRKMLRLVQGLGIILRRERLSIFRGWGEETCQTDRSYREGSDWCDAVWEEWDTGLAGAVGPGQEELSASARQEGGEKGRQGSSVGGAMLAAQWLASWWSPFFLSVLRWGKRAGQEGRGEGVSVALGVAARAELPDGSAWLCSLLQQCLNDLCVGEESVARWVDWRLTIFF